MRSRSVSNTEEFGGVRRRQRYNTRPMTSEPQDSLTPDEQRALAPYFTNTDRCVFALINLPETVKGALFARYSRSAKSLRRLFLDEFLGQMPDTSVAAPSGESSVGTAR